MSMTANFHFNGETRILSLNVYPGFMFVCSKSYEIPYSDIIGFEEEFVPNCKINKQPAFLLKVQTRSASYAVTGAKVRAEILAHKRNLDAIFNGCR
jgi:hypothetical protein